MTRDYGFPYASPYSIQLELMDCVYDAIRDRKIGFFESPTGTGKTLSLLCSALSWLRDQQTQSEDNVASLDSQETGEPDWIQQFRLHSARKNTDGTTPVPSKRSKTARTSAPSTLLTVDEKISSLMKLFDDSADTAQQDDLRANNYNLKSTHPKIFYCSRTHSQLAQVMDELKKTAFFRPATEKHLHMAITLGSRTNLCINSKVRGEASNLAVINDACQDLLETETGCPYYSRAKDAVFEAHIRSLQLRHIADIEDLVAAGKESNCCSYFSSRFLLHPADLAAVPYNIILHKPTRQALNINLADCVVIFDEAHNMVDFVKQLNSVVLPKPVELLQSVLDGITTYLSRYYARLSGGNVSALTQLQHFFTKIHGFLQRQPPRVLSMNEFIHGTGIDNINCSRLHDHLQNTRLFLKMFGRGGLSGTEAVVGLLHALESADADGRFILAAEELKYICTSPVDTLRDILSECRSVIFCGGTMSPIQDSLLQLVHAEMRDRTQCRAFGHLVAAENMAVSSLATGPSGHILNFSFDQRDGDKTIRELGLVVTNYCRIIPAGIVCFFASFKYMDTVLAAWHAKRITEGITRSKKMFVEKRGVPCDEMLEQYETEIKAGRGAIIFAVMNGKLSEGINFANDLGRGVIVVGLPYSNLHDAEVQEHVKAYVELMLPHHPGKSAAQLQTEYLDNVCMRVVNQTIGRAIRHKDDYAAIILIDERYSRESIASRLPSWIQASFTERSGKFDASFRATSQVHQHRSDSVFMQYHISSIAHAISPVLQDYQRAPGPPVVTVMLSRVARLPLSNSTRHPLRRLLSSKHEHAESGGLHFENHRIEDAMPFSYDNKFTFALKLGVFSAVGFAIPVFGVWWNM